MASLYEMLDNAHDGEAMTAIGSEFGLTATQAEAAVTALLPAIDWSKAIDSNTGWPRQLV